MKNSKKQQMALKKIALALITFFIGSAMGYSFNRLSPDCVIMKDGTRYEGLIIKNDADEIILQQPLTERTIQKAYVQRINDADKSMTYFADLVDSDKAPPWRMMVQDLRCNDAIKSFVQIPAARIEHGKLRNIPYLSFHVNKHGEMNIYGDPKDPACVELGAYLHGSALEKFQGVARQFFAGYIASRAGLATLYHLNINGDLQRSGKFIFQIMSPAEPEAHGGWWILVYDPERLSKARVSDAEYQQITLPRSQILTADGQVRRDLEKQHHSFLNTSMMRWLGALPGFHGFYRNGEDELRVMKNPS